MAEYSLKCRNNTNLPFVFALYSLKGDESGSGRISVAWKTVAVAEKGGEEHMRWNQTLGAAIIKEDSAGQLFVEKSLPAERGQKFHAFLESDGAVDIEKVPGVGPATSITIINDIPDNSKIVGLTIDDMLFSAQTVESGGAVQFEVDPNVPYHVGLFDELAAGSIITSDLALSSVECKYPAGQHKGSIEAYKKGQNYRLTYPSFQ